MIKAEQAQTKSGNGAIGYRQILPQVEITLPSDKVYVTNSLFEFGSAFIWFHNSTGLATCFNVIVKNLAFHTSEVITNAWFSMKN